jgi:hypothetical protein
VSVPGDEDKKVGLNVYRKKDIAAVEK